MRPHCIACEDMLADALDETLDAVSQRWFDGHVAGCADCSRMVADAQRGAAWLEMLKATPPEPPVAMLERILAQTGPGAATMPAFEPTQMPVADFVMPVRSNVLEFRPRVPKLTAWTRMMMEPRLAMTAAMAFFSIALTMNLTGVKLNEINASNLRPSSLKRSYYEANAHAVRYYDNLRVVRVLESRVDDLRQGSEEKPADAAPASEPKRDEAKPEQEKPKTGDGQGTSRRETPEGSKSVIGVSQTNEPARDDKNVTVISESNKEGGLA